MNSKILVHEGFTNNYLIPGILGFIVGVILSVILHYKGFPQFFPFVGAPIIGISLIMVSGTNGLEIDLDKMIFRKYGSFFAVKIGRWKSLETPESAELSISSERTQTFGTVGMVGYIVPNQGKLKSITNDVFIKTKTGNRQRIYDFLDYKNAKKALKRIESVMAIPIRDKVREKLIENIEKRWARGW